MSVAGLPLLVPMMQDDICGVLNTNIMHIRIAIISTILTLVGHFGLFIMSRIINYNQYHRTLLSAFGACLHFTLQYDWVVGNTAKLRCVH